MNAETRLNILRRMILIRAFEAKVADLAKKGLVNCPIHLYTGQEAIAASVLECAGSGDLVMSAHRNHGHYIAKGGDIRKLMAEIMCKADGCSGGKGGSMHTVDRKAGFVGSSAIVAGTVPISLGLALALKYKRLPNISIVFFGDGATDEGVFYECVNMAVLYSLPIVFVCENNDFATHLPNFIRQSNPLVSQRIGGFLINTVSVDGNSASDIYRSVSEPIDYARSTNTPLLIECKTYRWFSHAGYWDDLDVGYRKKSDVEYWKSRCPIQLLYKEMLESGEISEYIFNSVQHEVDREVNEACEYAIASPQPRI